MRCEVCQLQPTKCSATTQKLTRARTQKRPLSENRALSIRNNSIKRKQRTGRAQPYSPLSRPCANYTFLPLHVIYKPPAHDTHCYISRGICPPGEKIIHRGQSSEPNKHRLQTLFNPSKRSFAPYELIDYLTMAMIKTVQRVVHFRIYIPLLTWPEATKWPF
jgi:hypothetical protein